MMIFEDKYFEIFNFYILKKEIFIIFIKTFFEKKKLYTIFVN